MNYPDTRYLECRAEDLGQVALDYVALGYAADARGWARNAATVALAALDAREVRELATVLGRENRRLRLRVMMVEE